MSVRNILNCRTTLPNFVTIIVLFISLVNVYAHEGVFVNQTVEILPSDDAYLQNGNGNNNNLLRVQSGVRTSYLKFDISSFVGTINSLQLQLSVQGDSGNGTFRVHKTNSINWTENNLTSSNAPSSNNQQAVISGTFNIGNTYTIDLTDVTSNNGQFTIIISQDSGGNDFAFASKENSNSADRPRLFITGNCGGQGSPCDDDDPCTINDSLDADCNCIGQFNDTDNDGRCDALDQCLFGVSGQGDEDLDLDFSIDRGYYDAPFQLELTVNDPTATIRYTTNGTAPTISFGTIYSSPLTISTTSTIRAIAYSATDDTKVLTHTYIFANDVINQPNSVAGFPTSEFAFDTSVKNSPVYGQQLYNSLTTAPSISLVMNLNDFNEVHDGVLELPTSVELLLPDGQKGYQVNAGVERAGGSSFNARKRNFRLSFKSIYGDPKFDYPIFGTDAAEEFDQLALRAGFHGCMQLGLDHPQRGGVNDLSDQVVRNMQINMAEDNVGIHGDFMHVYINGIYWGVYNVTERGNNSFVESYYGGDKDNIDAIKRKAALDGQITAWNTLNNMVDNLDMANQQNYENVQKYVNVTHFADYNILTDFAPHGDDNNTGKNSFVTRDRTKNDGFRFWIWDTEPALGHYWIFGSEDFGTKPYINIFESLLNNADFTQLVADRVQCHCFEEGALTSAKTIETYNKVFDESRDAYISEAARWAAIQEYDAFVKKRDTITNNFLPGRVNYLLDLYRQNGAYPSIDAVQFNQAGGVVNSGFSLSLQNPNSSGTIYYTLDGSDPRQSGGATLPTASVYSGPISLSPGVYEVKARVRVGSTWSAMCPYTFYVNQDYSNIVINEIHYNPADCELIQDQVSGRNFEFVELKNCSSSAVNLKDMFFEKGIRYQFEESVVLQPEEFFVLAEDAEWFELRYGFPPDAQYEGKLSNSGENIWLMSPDNEIADSLDYNDNAPWPGTADKGYYSLALKDCSLDNAVATNWSIQSVFTTPGADNFFTDFGEHSFSGIVINEIHYNPFDSIVPGTTDTINGKNFEFIELKNIGNVAIDLGGTFFARGIDYEFAAGVVIQPGEFIVLAEDKSSFADRYGFEAFDKYDGQLNNGGEILWLVNSDGILLDAVNYDDAFPWDSQADGGQFDYSLALIDGTVNNNTNLNWRIQCDALFTPGAENDFTCFEGLFYAGLVINEIHYAPSQGENHEFLELKNNSFSVINLEQVSFTSGISYVFEQQFLLPGQFVVIARDSALFANTYGVSPVGQYIGDLSINGENLILSDLFGETIDEVEYGVSFPWTSEPLQGTKSLALVDASLDNNLAENWCTQEQNITPNAANIFADNDNDSIINCQDNCPDLDNALIGLPCDDGDSCTLGEMYDDSCGCSGGIFQDIDIDGVCDAEDQCAGINDGLIGMACDDGDPCTEGETYNLNCQCAGGAYSDSDNDGTCDAEDLCPGFDNTLIGQPCDDGDPCTEGETYNSNCQCSGGVFSDSDNDGICDAEDLCPGFDNMLIGQPCDDGDPCTEGETFDSDCECTGGSMSDSDSDGICDANDSCPNFDNNLIGQPCDDGIICFVGSTWDSNCNCTGGAFADTDGDNVCDPLDLCPGFDDNVDANSNGIPDGCEECVDYVTETNNPIISQNRSANIEITTNGRVIIGDIDYQAGQEINLISGFEVTTGAVFHAYIAPCN